MGDNPNAPKRNRRFLIIATSRKSSGIGRYAIELFRAFSSMQVPVHLLLYFRQLVSGDTLVQDIPPPSPVVPRLLASALKLGRFATKYSLFHMATPNSFDCLYNWRLRPIVATLHDLGGVLYRFSPRSRVAAPLGKKLFMLTIRSLNRARSQIITPTAWLRQQLVDVADVDADRIHVVPYGIDHSVFRPRNKVEVRKALGLPTDRPIVLHVSTAAINKNVPGALAIFKRIRQVCPTALFIRIGGLTPSQRLLASGLEKNLKVIDYVDPSQIAFFYNSADVYAHPSLEEGASFPLLEALASGVAVVASKVAPIPEVTGGAASLLDPTDLDGFATTVLNILNNEQHRKKSIELGLSRVKNLTWRNAAERTLGVYTHALEMH